MTRDEQDLANELSARMHAEIMKADPVTSDVMMFAIGILIGTSYAVGNRPEAEIVQDMHTLRDHAVNVFRWYRREHDVHDGELIRHDH